MPSQKYPAPAKAIGNALKTWRAERGLTMRAVAQESRSLPEPIAFDYLSRVERGRIMPSVPKLATLAVLYRKPITELIDLYETEQLRKLVPRKGTYALFRKLGIENLGKGLITKALACFLGAIDAAKREGANRQTLAMAHNNAGSAMIRAGRYFMARQYLEEGVALVESQHTHARLMDNLAIVHFHMDRMSIADLFSREAVRLAGDDPVLRPITRGTRSAVLSELKQFDEAEPLMREMIEDARRTGDVSLEIRWLYNLGSCLVEQGKVDEGLDHLSSAASKAAEHGDPDLRAKSLYFFGRYLYMAGRKEESANPLKSSLMIARDNDLRNEAFHSAYYLWQGARASGAHAEAADYLDMAGRYRERLQQRTEEVTAFDAAIAAPGTRTRTAGRSRPSTDSKSVDL